MRKPILTIFYQFNPWDSSIGGIQTIIRTFIKYAPEEFEIRLVGTSNSKEDEIGVWQQAEWAGRCLKFMPLFFLENDNERQPIPTTLKYTFALLGKRLESDFMHFHRLEPSLVTWHWVGDKTLFIHNDIRQQILENRDQKTILWQKFPQVFFALERNLIHQFSQIYSCNTDSLQYYKSRYPALSHCISYLKNTVDTEVFYPLTPEQRIHSRRIKAQSMDLPENTQFLLFAGRLHPQKDPLLLIRAIAALNDPLVHLFVAGEGELKSSIRNEIERLNLTQQITLLGAQTQSEMVRLQQICNLFILTSVYEGLPVVVLEALACGMPVITTQCGETPNLLVPGSGEVCQVRSASAIANTIRQLLVYPDFYSSVNCTRAVQPYAAKMVIDTIFSSMLKRYESSHLSSQVN
jgi:glycosyltransferase involved in cell wall biosynthesis